MQMLTNATKDNSIDEQNQAYKYNKDVRTQYHTKCLGITSLVVFQN